MEAHLTGIDRAEALRYLGVRGAAPAELSADVDRCAALLLETAKPRLTWRLCDRAPDGELIGTGWTPAGEDLSRHLRGCAQAVLLAATLGAEAEILLRRSQRRDLADAVILDACATAAIENVCDNFCADLAAELAPLRLTARFSPGYGDFPMESQTALFALMDVTRRIGVSLTESGLMLPQKSVTAVIGVWDGAGEEREGQAPPLQGGTSEKREGQAPPLRDSVVLPSKTADRRGASRSARDDASTPCETCALADRCAYRKEGKPCGTE